MRSSEDILRLTIEMAGIAVWEYDFIAGHMLRSDNHDALYGLPKQDRWNINTFLNAIHPEDREKSSKFINDAVAPGGLDDYAFDFRVNWPSGVTHWLWARGRVIKRNDSGQGVLVRGVLVDITQRVESEAQRKQSDEALHEAEEQFRGLVEQSIVGICIIQDEKFTYANPRIAEIMGLDSAKALIGSDPLSWIVETDRAEVARNMRRLLKGEVQNLTLEFGVLHRDGVDIRVGTNAARSTQRGKVAIVGVAQDISEKKRAERKILDYIEQLKTTINGTIQVIDIISEMRDPYTAGHERRVAQIAVDLAAVLGLDAHQQEGLRVAGNLHDVGKIAIPAEILSKPSKLSPIEYALVQGHAHAGYEILKNVNFSWPVAQVVLQHHERMDGSGYPQGLKGEAILFDARITAVADVVEAMGSHRPYRPGLSIETALDEIERNRGVKYDAKVVDACLKLFREKGYKLPT